MNNQNNPANINIRIWEDLLKEGVPSLHVVDMIKTHITGLEALPDHIEGKEQALKACNDYLQEVKLCIGNEN